MRKNRPLSMMETTKRSSLNRQNSYNTVENMTDFARFLRNKCYPSNRLYGSCRKRSEYKPKLFSLLDVNDKLTNCRGTSVPFQFERLPDKENQRLFGYSYRTDRGYDLELIKKLMEKGKEITLNNKSTEDKRKKNILHQKINSINYATKEFKNFKIKEENNDKKDKQLTIETDNSTTNLNPNTNINQNSINNINNNSIDNSNNNCNKEEQKTSKSYSEYSTNKKKSKILAYSKTIADENILKPKNRNDRWLPKGYPEYELLVQHPKLLIKKIKADPFAGKLPSYTLKEIREKSDSSDLLFLKEATNKEKFFIDREKQKKNDYNNSDIFNLKNDLVNILKSGEKYLFKIKPKNMYSITRESNSKWQPKSSIPTILNCSSKEYNILNPGKKNFSKTKEKIIIECANQKDNNSNMINNANYMNPIYKQKSISEFIDITRNGASNPGIDFIKCYQSNPNCFHKTSNVCSAFYDTHLLYKDICLKPFVMPPTLK